MTLPTFRYHFDPLATGSVKESTKTCSCCVEARGYVYCGPSYALEDLEESICPWCIANGDAHEEYEVEFTDSAGIGDGDLDDEIIEEVAFRTPGFTGWQQERWLACCDDAAQFLGRAGHEELKSKWPEAVESLQQDTGLGGKEWTDFLRELSADGSPTAYVFRCLHCKRYLAYQDSD